MDSAAAAFSRENHLPGAYPGDFSVYSPGRSVGLRGAGRCDAAACAVGTAVRPQERYAAFALYRNVSVYCHRAVCDRFGVILAVRLGRIRHRCPGAASDEACAGQPPEAGFSQSLLCFRCNLSGFGIALRTVLAAGTGLQSADPAALHCGDLCSR